MNRISPLLFSLILLANYFHCANHAVQGAGAYLAEAEEKGRAESAPVNPLPPVCDHEFGCICRGAITATVVTVERSTCCETRPADLATASVALAAGEMVRHSLSVLAAHQHARCDAHSAQELRAWLGSFVI